MKIDAYIDGGSRGNPGEAGAGVFLPGVAHIAEYLGIGTNNFAEYSALLIALRFAVYRECRELKVFSDSELVVRQVNGEYKVSNESIRELHSEAMRWISLIPQFSIHHIPREDNREADALANQAMDNRSNSIVFDKIDLL